MKHTIHVFATVAALILGCSNVGGPVVVLDVGNSQDVQTTADASPDLHADVTETDGRTELTELPMDAGSDLTELDLVGDVEADEFVDDVAQDDVFDIQQDGMDTVDEDLGTDAGSDGGEVDVVLDGDDDGYPDEDDCAPKDASIHPGAEELCDGLDNNCNALVDEGFPDTDSDGWKDCLDPDDDNDGYDDEEDCAPLAFAINPDALEACDGLDNDCDGTIDEELGSIACGLGVCAHEQPSCVNGKNATCDPFLGIQLESCDGLDNDCNGLVDDGLGTTTCGLGICQKNLPNCVNGEVQNCDPLAESEEEICDGLDNDCDGATDEQLGTLSCGLGICFHTVQACAGGVAQECNPFAGAQPETCDGVDNDCDGATDEGLGTVSCGVGLCEHEAPFCQDGKPLWCNPFLGAQAEVCDGVDNDCDGLSDEELGSTSCGLGICAKTVPNCAGGQSQTCDPFAEAEDEACDGLDNDCDGQVDEGLAFYDVYPDPDGDGFYGADLAAVQPSCAALKAAGFDEDGVYEIDPDGEGGIDSLSVYCDMTTDGGGWTLVFHHDIADGYWSGDDQSLAYNVDDPTALRYSILSHLEAFRSSDDSFDLRINWPETGTAGRNIWRQNSNPTSQAIAGYEPVAIDHATYNWGGLEYNDTPPSFIDGSVGISWWYYAIGSTTPWGNPPGIPAASGVAVARVSLWVRPDDNALTVLPEPLSTCGPVQGYAVEPGDCGKDNATVFPGAEEVCDALDNDCDGDVDEGFEFKTWYPDADGDGWGAGSGSSCSSLLVAGENEDGLYAISPDGLGGPDLTVFCDMSTDGGGWTRLFYHDVAAGYFASDQEAAALNQGDPLSLRYSILDLIESFRSSDGRFEFRIDWPETDIPGRNIWRQDSNPADGPVEGYEAVDVDYTSQYWGGLEPADNASTWLDGSVGHQNWFYSIGSQVAWGSPSGIPAYTPSSPRVALWVRNDDGTAGGPQISFCAQPEGYVDVSGDCDDSDELRFPDQEEACNGLDDNCDGEVDEGCPYGDLELTGMPTPLHFYPRDLQKGKCSFVLTAEPLGAATQVRVEVLQDDVVYIDVVLDGPVFALPIPLEPGLHLYDFKVYWDNGSGWWKQAAATDDVVCGDVFLVDGQSNAVASDYHSEHLGDLESDTFVRSFGSSVNNANVALDEAFGIAVADANYTHAAVGQWGLRLAKVVMETQQMPVLLINGAVGGTKVAQHQRNDSNPEDLGTIYGRLLWRVRKAGVDGSVRAIFWHQGESDGTMAYATYLGLWTSMYTDWLEDYPNVEGIYPFQVRAGCGNPTWNRNVHRELPDLLPLVTGNMSTTGVSGHDNCHFYHAVYGEWGERMARLVNRDLYGTVYELPIDAPNPQKATWQDMTTLVIDYGETGEGLVLEAGAEKYFSLSDGTAVTSATVDGQSLVLKTAIPTNATWVSFVDVPGDIPWLVNSLGIGGFAYYQFPITQ